jgi:glycosyltransferase involved in cell wall biosynthesis
MTAPLVSVAMATFGQADFIREAVDSILSQSVQDLELCICTVEGDASTRKRLRHYRDDPRVRIREVPVQSMTHQMNTAAYGCHGEWFMFFCSDDILLPGAIQAYLDYDRNLGGKSVLLYPDLQFFYDDRTKRKDEIIRVADHSHEALLENCYITDVSFVRREVFMRYMPMRFSDRRHMIWRIWKELSADTQPHLIQRFPQPTFRYRQHAGCDHLRPLKKRANRERGNEERTYEPW